MHDDVAELVAGLGQQKPDLVFNLVESFGDEIIGGQMGVTGILDLLAIPYTGGGPGELYLQEDKALAKKLLAYEGVLYPDFATFATGASSKRAASCGCRCSSSRCGWMPRWESTKGRSSTTRRS